MMRVISCFLVLILLGFSVSAEEITVRIRSPQSSIDTSHAYFASLLQLALDKTTLGYGSARVVVTGFNASQARVLKELAKGNYIDVEWAGTNFEREALLFPIRFPLVAGLTGWRIPIIPKERLEEFQTVRNLEDLKKYRAVQGMHWPDSDILEAAGLPVVRTARFEHIYPLLEAGRGDYSPRGIQAVQSELEGGLDRRFTAVTTLIIQYPFPMYFFTKKANEALGRRIETGLRAALADGSFHKHLKNHPVTAPIFPLSKFKNATVIRLANPFLPPETPLTEASLWLRLK